MENSVSKVKVHNENVTSKVNKHNVDKAAAFNSMKEKLDFKENNAATVYTSKLAEKTTKLATHNAQVATRSTSNLSAEKQQIDHLSQQYAVRVSSADQNVKALEAQKVQLLNSHNSKVDGIRERTAAIKDALMRLEAEREEKAKATKDALLKAEVERLAAYNAKVMTSGATATSSKGENSQATAAIEAAKGDLATTLRRKSIGEQVSNLQQHNQHVTTAGQLATATKNLKLAEIEVGTQEKQMNAQASYENIVCTTAVLAASHNDLVAARRDYVVRLRECEADALKEGSDYKEKMAEMARLEIQMERVMSLSRKNGEVHEKGSAVKKAREVNAADQLQREKSDFEEHEVRRELNLQKKVKKALRSSLGPSQFEDALNCFTDADGSPVKGRSPSSAFGSPAFALSGGGSPRDGSPRSPQSTATIQQRLNDAAVRRSAHLSERVAVAAKSSTPLKARSPGVSTCTSPKSPGGTSRSSAMLTREEIQQRSDDAAARRESLLLQRSEAAGMEVERAKNVALLNRSAEKANAKEKGIIGKDGELVVEGKKCFHLDDESLEVGFEVREIEDYEPENSEEYTADEDITEARLPAEVPPAVACDDIQVDVTTAAAEIVLPLVSPNKATGTDDADSDSAMTSLK